MAFLYILCGLFFLLKVNSNPVTELNTELDIKELKAISETSTLDTLKNIEIIETTTYDTLKDIEVIETTTFDTLKDIEIIDTTTLSSETKTSSDVISEKDCSQCIERKFLNHYFAKGCKPIPNTNGCDNCPKKFDCNQKTNISYGNNECIYNGNKYKIGESVPVPNPCQVCQCGYGFDARYHSGERIRPLTTIHCITVECPEQFAVHSYPVRGIESDFEKVKNCYNIYESGKCCSVKKECPDSEQSVNSSVCVYNDKTYQIGQKIYPNEDRCKVCICEENWDPNDPINNSGCYEVKCNLEIDHQLKEGCIPIYHSGTCCPIEYHCPDSDKGLTLEQERREKCSEPSDSGPCLGLFKRFYYDQRDGQCHSFVFGGCGGNDNNFRDLEDCENTCIKQNNIGEESETSEKGSDNLSINSTIDSEDYCLFSGNKYTIGHQLDIGKKCVDCECRIPPDFTCIHRSCPPPPTNRCKITYQPTTCCPVFDCSYEEKNDSLFDPQSCPTPMCAADCHFETYPDRCPDCVCVPPIVEELLPQIHDQEVPTHEVIHEVLNI